MTYKNRIGQSQTFIWVFFKWWSKSPEKKLIFALKCGNLRFQHTLVRLLGPTHRVGIWKKGKKSICGWEFLPANNGQIIYTQYSSYNPPIFSCLASFEFFSVFGLFLDHHFEQDPFEDGGKTFNNLDIF